MRTYNARVVLDKPARTLSKRCENNGKVPRLKSSILGSYGTHIEIRRIMDCNQSNRNLCATMTKLYRKDASDYWLRTRDTKWGRNQNTIANKCKKGWEVASMSTLIHAPLSHKSSTITLIICVQIEKTSSFLHSQLSLNQLWTCPGERYRYNFKQLIGGIYLIRFT